MDIYKMIYEWYHPPVKEILKEDETMHPEDGCMNECAPDVVLAVLGNKDTNASMPGVGSRLVRIEQINVIYNNVGDKKLYLQFAYTKGDKTFHWGLTYDVANKKLAKLFPNGEVKASDIGRKVFVEIGYCNSKNGEYPSIFGLSDDVQ